MKTILSLAAVAAFQLCSAQKTIGLKDFKSISVGADTKIKLVKSSENKLVINGSDDDNKFQIQNVGSDLVLNGGEDLDITVYYKNTLESITAASDAEVIGNDEINTKEFGIAAASDAKVELKLNVKKLHTNAASDAVVTLTGKATEHTAAVASDANLNSEHLITDTTNIVVSSDGEASVSAKNIVNATASSDGSIKIYGNPKKVNQTKADDGEITIVR